MCVWQCKQVLLYLLIRRERAPGWSGDDGLHLAPGQPMKRMEDCGSQEEGEHHEKLQLGLSSGFIGTGCEVANEAGGFAVQGRHHQQHERCTFSRRPSLMLGEKIKTARGLELGIWETIRAPVQRLGLFAP